MASAVALLLVASLCLVAVAQAGSSTAKKKPSRASISLLYVLNSARGTLHPAGGNLVLSLGGLEPHAVWFADRPARRSGTFPAAAFADAWKGFGFAADPPNAALDYTDPQGRERTVVLRLSEPHYAKQGGSLTFRARLLDPDKVKAPNLAAHLPGADRSPATRLRAVSLFIDDVEGEIIGGCYISSYTNCNGADLAGANLAGVNFFASQLKGVNLYGADLSGANLEGAQLVQTELQGADLRGADLAHAELFGANLGGADLQGANLSEASLTETVFCNTTMPDGSENNSGCGSQ